MKLLSGITAAYNGSPFTQLCDAKAWELYVSKSHDVLCPHQCGRSGEEKAQEGLLFTCSCLWSGVIILRACRWSLRAALQPCNLCCLGTSLQVNIEYSLLALASSVPSAGPSALDPSYHIVFELLSCLTSPTQTQAPGECSSVALWILPCRCEAIQGHGRFHGQLPRRGTQTTGVGPNLSL